MGSVRVCAGLVRLFGNQHAGVSKTKGRVGGLNQPIDHLGLIYVCKGVNKIIELCYSSMIRYIKARFTQKDCKRLQAKDR